MSTVAELTAKIEETQATLASLNAEVQKLASEVDAEQDFLNNGINILVGPVLRGITNRFKDLLYFLSSPIPLALGEIEEGEYANVSAGSDPRYMLNGVEWDAIMSSYWSAIDNVINDYCNKDDVFGDHPVKGSNRSRISHFLYGDHKDFHSGQNVIGINRRHKNFLPPFNYEK